MAIAERVSFQSYFKEKPEKSSQFQKHIEYFRSNWKREELPMNWADLPGTGFMINKQVDLIFSTLKPEDNAQTIKDKMAIGLTQTDRDIRGFILEYLAEGLVFPIHYKINSQGELIDSNYGNKRVVDLVSEEERDGVVKETLSKKIEPFLANYPDGSIAVMTSPKGWSGLHQENGESITFTDSQTYIWQKKGEDVLGFTVRTDFSNREHREMLGRLGVELPADAGIKDYVSNPALISMNNLQIKDIVDIMCDTRFNMSSGSLLAYKDKMWNEVYRNLDRRDELWKYDEVTKKMVQEFKDYVLTKDLSREDIKQALAVTILRIAKFLRNSVKAPSSSMSDTVEYVNSSHFETDLLGGTRHPLTKSFGYGKVLTDVQELPGCAGGGSTKKSLINSITSRFGESDFNFENEWFSCPKCKYKADGPIGDTCPGCGLTKEAFAEETGISCD